MTTPCAYNIRTKSWFNVAVKAASIPLFLIVMLVLPARVAAGDPVSVCRQVFSVSAGQWMCTELKSMQPGYFSCKSVQASPTGSRLNVHLLPESDVNGAKLSSVFDNGDNCATYLALRSLSDLYFPLFEKKLKAKGLPEHLKYLPLILSGLNQNHSSPDGRSGLWALDFLAARSVNLRIDTLADERRGGDFSTDAAVSYLSYLYESYDQSDAAVILAYVYGNGFLRQQMRKAEESWLQHLPAEHELFLRLYDYVASKFESETSPNQLSNYFTILGQYENMAFEQSVRYDALCAVLGVDEKAIRLRNPVYTGEWISPGARRVSFVLDAGSAARFPELRDSIYNWRPPAPVVTEEPRVFSKFHKVKRGETLGGIAARYHISISQLKKWNKIKGTTIYPGQRLKVSAGVTSKADQEPAKSGPETPLPVQEGKREQPAESKPERQEVNSGGGTGQGKVVTYTVKQGDTLWRIASKYKGVTPDEIKAWNKCSDHIRPGQKLKIHLK